MPFPNCWPLPLYILFLFLHAQWAVGQDVNTTSGTVVGHKSRTYSEVSEYLGIPYGQSTEGKNRFMPPKRFTGKGVIQATNFGAGCPQTMGPIGALAALSDIIPKNTSEDCLFVNVWTKLQTGEKKKAVMLWIYGGGFSFGDTSQAVYNGAGLANNQDVVVVSFNYRVNLFGFPGAPGLSQMNPGLLDQRLAVEWTRDNVAGFGGDPERITLFGESAGAFSVDFYSYKWKKDPIVKGFIAQSGSAMGFESTTLQKPLRGHAAWFDLTSKAGCGGKEAGPSTVECMQGKTVKQLQDMSIFGFTPWIDDETIFSDVHARARAADFVPVPLLIGSNQNESVLFSAGRPPNATYSLGMDNEFRCGGAEAAKARSLLSIPVWRYIFAGNKPGSTSGASHADDLRQVFGDGKAEMSSIFQPAWAAFAKDPANGLSKLGWPKYDARGKTLVRIGYDSVPGVDFVQADMYDGTCPRSRM